MQNTNKITTRCKSFHGVVAGETATLKLEIGLTYHALLLTYSGATLAQLKEIRLVADGKPVQRYKSATFIDTMNKFDGLAAAAGVLRIPIGDRPGMRTRAGEEFTALGTGIKNDPQMIETLTLEVDIDAAAIGTVLSAKAIQSAASQLRYMRHIREFTYNAPAAGDFEITDIPKGALISRVWFDSSLCTKLAIDVDRYRRFERTPAENDMVQTDGYRVPQTGFVVFDPTEDGHAAESLVTAGVQDLRFILTMSGAEAIPVTVEYVGPLGS